MECTSKAKAVDLPAMDVAAKGTDRVRSGNFGAVLGRDLRCYQYKSLGAPRWRASGSQRGTRTSKAACGGTPSPRARGVGVFAMCNPV
eukprot:3365632-Pleurochrysis_carterae.AAC.1